MEAKQLDDIRDNIQSEIDKLEKKERECAEAMDYANALYCFHHRLGLQHAWQIVIKNEIKSENPNNP